MSDGGEAILVERDSAVTTIVINRPEVRNALDARSLRDLAAAFADFERDDAARVAVLTGAGGAFCAGADLRELARGENLRPWAGTDGLLSRVPDKPVIAAVAGPALAGGLALAVWCDLRVVEEDAVFGVFCRRWGAPMTNGATIRLPRLVGMGRALDMLLTGRAVRAEEALAIGLATRVVPRGQGRAEAERLAREIAAFPQLCLRADRRSAHSQWELDERSALALEAELGQAAFREETQAGARRFVAGAGRHGRFDD